MIVSAAVILAAVGDETGKPGRPRVRPVGCKEPGCEGKHRARFMCYIHYREWHRRVCGYGGRLPNPTPRGHLAEAEGES